MRNRAMTMLWFFGAFTVFLVMGLIFVNKQGMLSVGISLIVLAVLMIVAVIVYDVSGRIRPGWVKRLERSGVEAQAVILENNAMKGIGGYEGSDVWLDLPVRVQPVDGPAFEARMKCRLSQTFMLKPNGTVTVRYDPADKNRVALVGNEMTDLMTRHMK